MEGEADDPVGDHAPDFHLRDGEREVRRKPQRETERMRGVVRKALSREKHPVVKTRGLSRKGQLRPQGSPPVKPAAIQFGNRLVVPAGISPKKKVTPRVPFWC